MTFKKYFFLVLIISTVINNPLYSQTADKVAAPVQEQDLKIEDQESAVHCIDYNPLKINN